MKNNNMSLLKLVSALSERVEQKGSTEFRRSEIIEVAKSLGMGWGVIGKIVNSEYRVYNGVFDLASLFSQVRDNVVEESTPQPNNTMKLASQFHSPECEISFIPEKTPEYVRWGDFDTVKAAVASGLFFPIYISGMSGNGKTLMVQQICAELKRECIRVQISPETDESDLLGSWTLQNGNTLFQEGPVLTAMRRGSVLLIDEMDRATNKIMAIQGVLEGKPVVNKKTNELVSPSKGFTVIATANTKGKGSDDGRYNAASIIDDAFLERFVAAIDQPFPPRAIERRIIVNHMKKYDSVDTEFADMLAFWSEVIHKTFETDGIDEVISTRRLCHIVQCFSVFKDRMKAIELCTTRFDSETRAAFIELYNKIDPSIVGSIESAENIEDNADEDII